MNDIIIMSQSHSIERIATAQGPASSTDANAVALIHDDVGHSKSDHGLFEACQMVETGSRFDFLG